MTHTRFLLGFSILAVACSGGSSGSTGNLNPDGGGDGSTIGDTGPQFEIDEGPLGDGIPPNDGNVLVIDPKGFTATEIGGYKLGPAVGADGFTGTVIAESNDDGGTGCDYLLGVVRDFKGANEPGGHPDFEAFSGSDATTNLVQSILGTDQKPVYAGICDLANPGDSTSCPYGQQMTTKANYDEWYRFTDGVNKPYLVFFQFEPNAGVYTFESQAFFPLDNAGWGNTPGQSHNFSFTTEVHTQFTYNGGETFNFIGDDDVWVFINKKLAIDMGGLHSQITRNIALDAKAGALGLTKGTIYDLDLFHAERHTSASDFRIDTTLSFVNCGTAPPDIH